jgi:transcriptional regulator with XRE-family HTH domain
MRIVKMPKFSTRLKELRKEKHLKQVEMAKILECTETHYQQIEYGHVNIPSLTLEALADFFNVSTDYLLGRSDDRRTL